MALTSPPTTLSYRHILNDLLSYKHRHMLPNDCLYPKINNLRVLLNCFYAYLISNAFQYGKLVILQYPYSFSPLYPGLYISIRSIVSGFCISLYSILIIYALWFERVGILIISIILLIILLIIRFIFDIYGYSTSSFKFSLYPPFEILTSNINITQQKHIMEEITDFTTELIMNIIGILLTILIMIRIIRKKWRRTRRELEALRIDVIRRMTV